MAGFSADSSAAARLADELRRVGIELAELEPVNAEAGRAVVHAARPPRRSGALAAGSRADVSRSGVAFASTVRYWTFVHWGAPRRHIRARPFFVEALAATRGQLADIYAKHARESIGKVQ